MKNTPKLLMIILNRLDTLKRLYQKRIFMNLLATTFIIIEFMNKTKQKMIFVQLSI
jgi:hypothetical protein